VQIQGPPIEYGAEERAFARGHWSWWASLSLDQKTELEAAAPSVDKSRGKKASIEGLGVELPGSQRSQSRKAVSGAPKVDVKKRVLGLDGAADVPANSPTPRRVLRARKARGKVSESPEKGDFPIKHELRDGTVYVDEDGEPETQDGLHELRMGKSYRDRK